MRVRYLVGLPVAVMAMVPVFGFAASGTAQARVQTYSCTAESWGGEQLGPLTVESKYGVRAAKGLAKTEWRGEAKYSSIECTPV
ncbi:hypothetical protein IU501_25170 [Nocardia otitidiscaviarum]|uniref:Secreted protein n=1 Tax=Nocardia otitidiscaviarum TaxID=1823 RepID=A0A379JJ06_9NOCA|nr:hypothetical protein [Nocardia otitidiscaviarum]MBF6136281.1 hypothetical protein [Nocardia otitidiscaviarum]MBF6241477.1 hypothetical protein [Nocardia otitidiscaviarum]MBF6484483.1 hypothetical protein [Nocardia otitidiscaviarum]MCP9619138.1 hypothetical protein [Nocardia otitidiscaviarum]QDP79617.1 hypothetical protein FOH10_13795 [Nocardia otitidiscaviarum]